MLYRIEDLALMPLPAFGARVRVGKTIYQLRGAG